MSSNSFVAERLERQLLGKQKADSPEQVVRTLGALQSQDYESALWGIGARMKAGTRKAVEAAVQKGSIVRSWPLRGTQHFVPGEDLSWLLALSRAPTLHKLRLRQAALELTPPKLARCERAIMRALSQHKTLTRDAAFAVFEATGLSPLGQRGYHVFCYLALHGVLCFGAPDGKQATVTRVDGFLPKQRQLAEDEALAELATRYLQSRAPATQQDFAWWSGLSAAQAKRGLAAAHGVLARDKPARNRGKAGRALLLAAFDEYLLGYKDRSAVLAREHAKKVVPGGNGVFLPTLVLDGQVVGLWRRKSKRTALEIRFAPFVRLDEESRARLEQAAASYARFQEQALLLV